MKKNLLAASCSFDLSNLSDHFVLIPEGVFRSEIDGRPYDAPHWELTPERGHQMAAALNQRKIDMVIDYEHATLKSKTTGEPAPAAGWLKSAGFTYVEGVGLCSTDFEWLDKAKTHIEAKEYKYISPVFLYTKTGDITALINVALTNTPALDQLPEAKLAAAAQELFSQDLPQQDSTMEELLEQLRWMLNLPLSTTAEEIKAELGKLQTQISDKTGVVMAANGQNLFDAVAAIDQLKTAANNQQPDLSKFVPIAVVSGLQAQIATLTANSNKTEIDTLYTAACSNGQLLGDDMQAWGRKLADEQPEEFKKFVGSAPKIAALNGKQTDGTNVAANKQQGQGNNQFTPEDLAVAAAFGHSLES